MTMVFKSAKGEDSVGLKTKPECHFLSLWTPTVLQDLLLSLHCNRAAQNSSGIYIVTALFLLAPSQLSCHKNTISQGKGNGYFSKGVVRSVRTTSLSALLLTVLFGQEPWIMSSVQRYEQTDSLGF